MSLSSDILDKSKELIDNDQFIVDVIVKGSAQNQKIIILLDGDNGSTIDQCARLSREIGFWIEENELIEHKYILEVSSPGVDEPLKLPRQFKKNIGRKLKIETVQGDQLIGKLTESTEEEISIEVEHKKQGTSFKSVPLEEIKKAIVQISFK